MVKYIFYMLLGLFLISKVVSVSGDIEECETLHAIVDTQHHPEKWHTLSEKFLNHYEAGMQCESYDNQTDDVSIGNNFSFRCTSPSKILRNNTASIIARIVKSLKILLPEEKTTSFSFSINPFCMINQYLNKKTSTKKRRNFQKKRKH